MTSCSHCGALSASLYCTSCGNRKSTTSTAATPTKEVVYMLESPEATMLQQLPASPPAPVQLAGQQVLQQFNTKPVSSISGNIQDIGKNKITIHPELAMRKSDEAMAWQSAPGIQLLIPLALKYITALLVIGGIFRDPNVIFFLLLAAAIHCGLRFFELTQTKYRLTTQRLEVTSGMFNSITVTYEVHQLGNAVIYHPFYLKLFKLANVHIANGPSLRGVANPEAVRDVIREFGQTEASRAEKIRWRS